jgi:uncharacterized protein YndB with AHSA1/START domain
MKQEIDSNKIFQTERSYPFSSAQIFSAFEDPLQLAQWWGPKGFTNTFQTFEFKNNGLWEFIMHAPQGQNYINKCIFTLIELNKKIVIKHVVQPNFTLTIDLMSEGNRTKLIWTQEFDDSKVAESMRHIVINANEENLDKLNSNLQEKIGKNPTDSLP